MNHQVLVMLFLAFAGGQEDTELKTNCLMQRRVIRDRPFHLSDEEADAAAHAEYLRSALVMVKELASNVTKWDTNLSQSERNSLDLIKDFISNLAKSAEDSHDEDQREVQRAKGLITECANVTKTSLSADVAPLKNRMTASRQDHNTCRTNEADCQKSENNHCAEWETYRKTTVLSKCAGVDFKAQINTAVPATKASMEQCLRELQPFYLKHVECWKYGECVDQIAPLCDKNQTEFERDFCEYERKLSGTCQAQIDCRKKHIKFRNDTHADVEANEAARKADYRTSQLVLCYFQVFEANNTNKSAILRGCEQLAVNTSQLNITYPAIPAAESCVKEKSKPCDNDWVSAEYNAKDWKGHVTMLDCAPCQVPTPAPTAPPQASFQYLKFTIVQTGTSNHVCINGMKMTTADGAAYYPQAVERNGFTSDYGADGPKKWHDGTNGHWCGWSADGAGANLVLNMGQAHEYKGYAFKVHTPVCGNDPRKWSLSYSSDGSTWTALGGTVQYDCNALNHAHDAWNNFQIPGTQATPAPTPKVTWNTNGWSVPQFSNGGRDIYVKTAGMFSKSNFANEDITVAGPQTGVKFKCDCRSTSHAITDRAPSWTSGWNMDRVFVCQTGCKGKIHEFDYDTPKASDITYTSLSSVIEMRLRNNLVEYLVDGKIVYTSGHQVDPNKKYHYAISWGDADTRVKDIEYIG